MKNHAGNRVVVTGTGVITPLGCHTDTLWDNLLQGNSGIKTLSVIDVEEYTVKIGGDVPDFDLGDILPPKDARRIDRFTQFALHGAVQAMQQSGLKIDESNADRCGVIVGSGIGGLNEIETQMGKLYLRGPDRVSPFTVPKMMLNAAGGNLAIHLGMLGPNYAVATACASATNAMGNALRSIRRGDTDVMVTGGSEAAITRMGLAAFQNMKALSTRNEDPGAASRPFDIDRDGFVLSEGAGVLVFESMQHAVDRGAEILCEVLGFGCTCDAGHITQPDPHGTGAGAAMRVAMDDAAINPKQIDYINAHGTSTPLGDAAETAAIRSVLGDHADKVAVSSTKSALGHSLGASGGTEAVILSRTLQSQTLPPTINLESPDPKCDLDYVPNTARDAEVKIAMSNSFGFGGHNACIIMGRV
ncbi:MAG: beta-ketoacyl-ACP synthase II [Planctomycetota bacterium]